MSAHQEPNMSHRSSSLHPRKEDLPDVEPGQAGSKDQEAMKKSGEKKSPNKSDIEGSAGPGKGLGAYPISDLQFDLVTIIYEKSKALQAYDHYLRDSKANPEINQLFEQIKQEDRHHIEQLSKFLGRC